MSERSSFLQFFDNNNIGNAYNTVAEEHQDLRSALFMLTDIIDRVGNNSMNPRFAQKELVLLRVYFTGRTAATLRGDNEERFGFFRICEKLKLNNAEIALLFWSVCLNILDIPAVVWQKLRELRGTEAKNTEGAMWFYHKVTGLLGEPAAMVRSDIKNLLFSSDQKYSEPVMRRTVNYVISHGRIGEEADYVLQRFTRRIRTGDDSLKELILHKDLLEQLETVVKEKTEDWTLCIRGSKGSGKTLLASHIGRSLGRDLMVLEGEKLADYKKETAVYFRLEESREWFYEWLVQICLSGDLVVLSQVQDTDRRLIRSFVHGLMIVLDDKTMIDRESPEGKSVSWDRTILYELPYPDTFEKSQLWNAFLNEFEHDEGLDTMTLASKYVLNAGGIREALFAADARAHGMNRRALNMDDLIWAIRQSQSGGLSQLAQPVKCVFEWDDLVVEEQVKKQMRYVCAQIQYRYQVGSEWGFYEKMPYGRGVSALFYGPPGTGKTMAAQVMAKELGYDLYRVDLSQMVSKYIGETEKNITELFERARHMNVILFFDEADALFSKRSEVKDSNDRNANTEAAHLLQQMEAYEGIILLCTNMKDNMDDAFKRRIKFMINFSMPSAEIREKLWHSILPAKTPRESGLDLDFFAQNFELTGSQIKDVLLNAAFMAAQQGTVLCNEHIKEALCMNYNRVGKTLTKNDFGYLG